MKRLIRAGRLQYVVVGLGEERPRKAFTEADVEEFIKAQSRRDVPWSPKKATRRTASATSPFRVLDFSEVLANEAGETPGTLKKRRKSASSKPA